MKFIFYNDFQPGLLKDDKVIQIGDLLSSVDGSTPQLLVEGFIKNYNELKPSLEKALKKGAGLPLKGLRLRPPVPKPGLLLCGIGGYKEGVERVRPLDFFLKGWTSIIGPGDTIVLPPAKVRIFHHEAELAVIIGKTTKNVSKEGAMDSVFGYTTFIDVSGRDVPDTMGFWPQKSFDTFGPMGPALVTKDEIPDPYSLDVKLWVNGKLRQNYNTNDMSHDISDKIKFLSDVCTLSPGDVVACGTNHQGLGPLQDEDLVDIEIDHVGRMSLTVKDPLKREWERGIDEEMARRVRG